jgi:hypothetical protein
MAMSPAGAALTPLSYSGLSKATGVGDDLTVTGDNPQIIMKADLPAASYNFLVFNIRGGAADGPCTGTVYFKMCGCYPPPEKRVPFRWKCDGVERKVIIPLYTYPEWQGRLTEVRLNLLDPPGPSLTGSSVQIRGTELVSFITDTTGP